MRASFLALACLVGLLSGCARSFTYEVSVKNATSTPLTAGLVKEGPPFDPRWASPEDMAIGSPGREEGRWGGLIAPGQGVFVKRDVKFSGPPAGILRIYAGEHSLGELLAMGRHDNGRLDVPVHPGNNVFTIIERQGKLVAERVGGGPAR